MLQKIKYFKLLVLVLSLVFLNGCIPTNENVGKPMPNNYKTPYYGGGYNNGYYR